jgi:presenilin-like A22 family membrane protease
MRTLIASLLGAALLIAKYSPLSTVLDLASALMSMGVAAGVGIFFGFYQRGEHPTGSHPSAEITR